MIVHRWKGHAAQRAFFTVASVAWLSIACSPSDPGWHYHAPNGARVVADGVRYELREEAGVKARVYADFFAGGLSVDVEIQNTGGGSLEVGLDEMGVTDAKGQRLKQRSTSANSRCGGEKVGARCVLAPGQSCQLAGRFSAPPLRRRLILFEEANPDLRELMVSVGPLQREGHASPLSIKLIWDRPK
jgi:hypothetical protein